MLRRVFRVIDLDQKGFVTLEEFIHFVTVEPGLSPTEKRERSLRRLNSARSFDEVAPLPLPGSIGPTPTEESNSEFYSARSDDVEFVLPGADAYGQGGGGYAMQACGMFGMPAPPPPPPPGGLPPPPPGAGFELQQADPMGLPPPPPPPPPEYGYGY